MNPHLLDDLRDGISLALAPLTVDQYHQMIRDGILIDGEPIELLEGTLVYKDRRDSTGGIMTHGGRHLKTLNKLTALLSRWVVNRSAFLQVQGPITLDNRNEPEPDCSLIMGAPDDFGDAVPNASSLLAAFEVADSSLRTDRRTKQRLYAEASIPLYVIINLKDNLIEVHSEPLPTESRYGTVVTYQPHDNFELPIGVLGVLTINGSELF
jgi:hypothetical protein